MPYSVTVSKVGKYYGTVLVVRFMAYLVPDGQIELIVYKVHLHCTVSNLKRIRKILKFPSLRKISVDAHDCMFV